MDTAVFSIVSLIMKWSKSNFGSCFDAQGSSNNSGELQRKLLVFRIFSAVSVETYLMSDSGKEFNSLLPRSHCLVHRAL